MQIFVLMCKIFKIFFKSRGSECTYNSFVWNKIIEGWKERPHQMIREWLLGTDQTRRYGLLLSRLVQSETWLYSMETSPRHDQERSRKQRGLWINKFCEFIVNASPKAPVNKTFTWGCFLHNCCLCDLTVLPLFAYVQNIFPLHSYSALLISSMWVP